MWPIDETSFVLKLLWTNALLWHDWSNKALEWGMIAQNREYKQRNKNGRKKLCAKYNNWKSCKDFYIVGWLNGFESVHWELWTCANLIM